MANGSRFQPSRTLRMTLRGHRLGVGAHEAPVGSACRTLRTMPLGVYVIHYRAPDWVRQATDSVLRSDLPIALTVIDNSGDPLDLDDRVRVIRNAANLGFAGGANVAITDWLAGPERYCVVAAHDIDPDPECFQLLVEAAERHPDVGILGPDVDPGGCGHLLGTLDDGTELRTWVSGTLMLLRRQCIDEIGCFDERFGSYVEDKDLGLRANDAGWKVGRVPTTTVRGRGSGTDESRARIRANHVWLVRKRGGLLPAIGAWLRIPIWLARHSVLSVIPNGRRAEHRSALGPHLRGVGHRGGPPRSRLFAMTMSDATPELSVIIPAHNAGTTLPTQLAALRMQETSTSFEVVVVDNGSVDDTGSIVLAAAASDPRIRLVRAMDLQTPGYSRNVGYHASRARLLAFCDADDRVRPAWVEAMRRALDQHPVVMGSLDYTRLNPSWQQRARGSDGVRRLGLVDGVFPYVISACLGATREAFEAVGGFDESMRVGQDVEFSWRCFQANIPIHFAPEAVVDYRLRTGLWATFVQARNYGRARMEIRRRMDEAGLRRTGGIRWRNIGWLVRNAPRLATRPGSVPLVLGGRRPLR